MSEGHHQRPRWVTGTLVALVIIAVAFVVMHLTIGSPFDHGGGSVPSAAFSAAR